MKPAEFLGSGLDRPCPNTAAFRSHWIPWEHMGFNGFLWEFVIRSASPATDGSLSGQLFNFLCAMFARTQHMALSAVAPSIKQIVKVLSKTSRTPGRAA
jgi:hypothetical protein